MRQDEDGYIPAEFMKLLREKRSVVVEALRGGACRDALEAYEQLAEAVGKKGLMVYLVKITFYRLIASTDPAVVLQSAKNLALGPVNATTQKLWRFILGILEESAYLKGCPVSWRSEAVDAHITIIIRFNKISKNPAWDAEQLSFDLMTLNALLFRNVSICEKVVDLRSKRRAQDSADLRAFWVIVDMDPGRFAGAALETVNLRVLLGCYINEPRLWENRRVAIISDTKERLTAMASMPGREGEPEYSRQMSGRWLQTQEFTCTTCGKFHSHAPYDDEGYYTEPFTGFKCCAYCHQAQYCSQACQRKDWKELGHKMMCSRVGMK